ncbi:MAG: carbamoyltransferase N-terminal domain-containing protein, partial [archaeon]
MYVLGLSVFVAGSSACLLKDGEILCLAAEERFTRRKNESGFPYNSISFCLDYAGISIDDVGCVGFYVRDSVDNSFLGARGWVDLSCDDSLCYFPKSSSSVVGILRDELSYGGAVERVGYCPAHAYGSFLSSGFDDAVFVLVDDAVDR